MPFPLSAKGSIDVGLDEDSDAECVMTAIFGALRDERPSELSRRPSEIHFRGGVFRLVSNSNQLVAITSGIIRYSTVGGRARIDYRITFTQMFLLVPAMLVLLWILSRAAPLRHPPSWQFFVFAWFWLFGGNYALACFRFPRFLRRTIDRTR